jgi:hypothetical protein
MRGRLTYLTTQASTPRQSPLTVADFSAIPNIVDPLVTLGEQQDLFLYWGYSSRDPYYKDERNVSRSAAGVVEVTNFGSTKGFRFSIQNVVENRNAQVNEYAIMAALNEELMAGTLMYWYPDFDLYPTEYFSCVASQRIDPKRMGSQYLWQFDFDLMQLPTVQFPSTVPTFALN